MQARRVVFRLTREEKQMLRELAAWNQTSMAEMVRRMIDEEHESRFNSQRVQDLPESSAVDPRVAKRNDG